MSRPETPNTSLASLILALSSCFGSRLRSAERLSTSLRLSGSVEVASNCDPYSSRAAGPKGHVTTCHDLPGTTRIDGSIPCALSPKTFRASQGIFCAMLAKKGLEPGI
jgi:hypothetical protein